MSSLSTHQNNDQLGRPMKDLRISLIDQCNMRCRYCMPEEVFGKRYPFLKPHQLLSFDQIVKVVQAAEKLGVSKVRLTGGEPLLRRNIDELVRRIAQETSIEDLALTTNGLLLKQKAQLLKSSGLQRVNVSLDAIDAEVFRLMSGGYGESARVMDGILAARDAGLQVKVNAVVKRGVNEAQVVPLLQFGMKYGVEMRFIEYMDVGACNGWDRKMVYSEAEILNQIRREYDAVVALPGQITDVSRSYSLNAGSHAEAYTFGVIASITRPFCGGCVRARISSNGELFTCLFSDSGHNLRDVLDREFSVDELSNRVRSIWNGRKDQHSQLRNNQSTQNKKVEMSFIGG